MTKLRRWEVWRRQDGTTYLTWGTKENPVETETLVSSFYSANWLSAEREAFGSDPEIDEGVQPLVEVLHLFSGVMSTTACQGHPERGDVTARRTASFRRCGRGADSFPEGGSYGYRETGVAQ